MIFDAEPYGISLEVYSQNSGEFSIHDGTAWRGPFPVVGGVPCAMFLKASELKPAIRCKFKALHSSNRVLVRVYQAVSPEQIAAAGAMA